MARVVIITPYFWPDIAANVPLITSLVEDSVKNGFKVTVITSYPGRNIDELQKKEFINNIQRHKLYHGAKIIRLPNIFVGRHGMLAKLFEYCIFTTLTVFYLLVLLSKTDLAFVGSNPPLINLVINLILRLKKIPLIYNLQDLFPDSAIDNGKLKNKTIIKFLRKLEYLSYKSADLVITISSSFEQHVLNVTSNANVCVIPNWVDTGRIDFIPREENSVLLDSDLKDTFIVSYAGNIGFAQNLEIVLECAEKMREYKIAFVIIGDGQNKAAIQNMANNMNLTNVYFLPFQPEDKVAEVFSLADVGLVTMKKGTGHSSVPSKTWMIMACKRPVIACIDHDSDLAEIIKTSDAGIVVSPSSALELKNAILKIYQDKALNEHLGSNGRRYVEQNISRQVITKEYCNCFLQVLNK